PQFSTLSLTITTASSQLYSFTLHDALPILLLVDFKGGATFADTDRLPHSAGLITNLADDDGLVMRFREAMYGELTRRQQLLKDRSEEHTSELQSPENLVCRLLLEKKAEQSY